MQAVILQQARARRIVMADQLIALVVSCRIFLAIGEPLRAAILFDDPCRAQQQVVLELPLGAATIPAVQDLARLAE
ncbi:hypothetical protein ALQ92_200181 [Pseudomonas syringae pv. pisi]|nr:hypothetical protein ALQ92_200181 [Pseudomonas syringae pv. pisi]